MRHVLRVAALAAVLAFLGVGMAKQAAAKDAVEPYMPSKWVLSGSLGLGGLSGVYGSGMSPLFGVSAEYGVNDKISIGGAVGHAGSSEEWYYGKWSYGYTIVAARGSYHFGDQLKVENLDAYAGLSLGYNVVSAEWEDASGYTGFTHFGASSSYVVYGLHGGGRYWFSPKFAGFGEVGFGLGALVLGVSTRF